MIDSLNISFTIGWNEDPTKGFDNPGKAKAGENGKDENKSKIKVKH